MIALLSMKPRPFTRPFTRPLPLIRPWPLTRPRRKRACGAGSTRPRGLGASIGLTGGEGSGTGRGRRLGTCRMGGAGTTSGSGSTASASSGSSGSAGCGASVSAGPGSGVGGAAGFSGGASWKIFSSSFIAESSDAGTGAGPASMSSSSAGTSGAGPRSNLFPHAGHTVASGTTRSPHTGHSRSARAERASKAVDAASRSSSPALPVGGSATRASPSLVRPARVPRRTWDACFISRIAARIRERTVRFRREGSKRVAMSIDFIASGSSSMSSSRRARAYHRSVSSGVSSKWTS